MHRLPALLMSLTLLCLALPASATDEDEKKPSSSETGKSDVADKPDKPIPEAKVWVSKHTIKMNGASVSYTATAGTMQIRDDEKDEPIALFGFTAYVKDGGNPGTRPIVFAYNGGPGSASGWLHMGILGPKRTVLKDLESNTAGPFRTVDNDYSILDRADLVMIDPFGTGFSRPIGEAKGEEFWGVDQDIKSVSDFIVRYLNQYGRWSSPKFILGESYGGMRTAGVAYALLTEYSVALNGVILVSPYLDFSSGNAGLGMNDPYVNFLPTYAATAWYHHALADRPAELQPFLREAEAFAQDVYGPVLFKGSRASPEERQTVLAGLARYTGLSEDYWDRANLRIDESRFLQELMRKKGIVVGRIDTRYTGSSLSRIAESSAYDPYDTAVGPAIVATFNDYYRRELKVESDRKYILSGGLWESWDNRHAQPDMPWVVPYANTVVDLGHTMIMNPKMKVLVQTGYFDLACPYRTVEYAMDHLDVPPALHGNVTIEHYDAGHMMYVHPESMQKFKRDLAGFVDANADSASPGN
jgi:carboxypeptidase C (cathepsin A)